jgi:hypothetical protein
MEVGSGEIEHASVERTIECSYNKVIEVSPSASIVKREEFILALSCFGLVARPQRV